MKKILLLPLLLLLSGCGKLSHIDAQLTGYSLSCVTGVEYIQFASGVSVQYGKDGKVVNC